MQAETVARVFALALGVLFQVALSASLPALLATSAVITAVVGLAMQETLGNLFSGVALALERTVQVGDMVRSGETIGLVEQLSWRSIKVRTMEGHSILIPNSLASRERFEVYPEEFERVGDRLLVTGRWKAEGIESGVTLEFPATWVLEVRDGKIVYWHTYSDREQAREDVGLEL